MVRIKVFKILGIGSSPILLDSSYSIIWLLRLFWEQKVIGSSPINSMR